MMGWTVLLCVALTPVAFAAEPDTVVVCPALFRQALSPWVQYRSLQGHTIVLVAGELAPQEIRAEIRKVAQGKQLRFVMLVGDANPALESDPAVRMRCVPTHYVPAKVNVAWGSEAEIATDNWYADLDSDQVPDVAIGRLTVRSPLELATIVQKILAYERSVDVGPWRRQVNVVASVGNFGALADTLVESAARFVITRGIPEEYRLEVTYGNWRSPYCPDPRWYHATAMETLNEGAWLWIFIGHGHWLWLPGAQTPTGWTSTVTVYDEQFFRARHGPPIAALLACYAGRFDAEQDCLAATMLRSPGGPVAVIAGSRMTMPYGMALLASELMDQCFRQHCPTIGEALLLAKRKMVKEPATDRELRVILDTLAMAVSPAGEKLQQERLEHVWMMNLLGDPLLRMRYGQPIEMPSGEVHAGKTLVIRTVSPLAGRCTVELVNPLGTLPFTPPTRKSFPATAEELAALQSVYQRANDGRLAAAEVEIEAGAIEIRLAIPAEARGKYRLRAFVEGHDDFALGSTTVEIVAGEEGSPPAQIPVAGKTGTAPVQR
jgi:hypothetical protein